MPETILKPREDRLRAFVGWVAAQKLGDEKSHAQIFLDRLFVAFGHSGVMETGGTLEFRVSKDPMAGGGTGFADFVWKPKVLIEMKRRGADLARA